MKLILVGVATLLAGARGGPLHAPSASLELPRFSYGSPASTYNDQHMNSFDENNLQDKAISYSVSQTDYNYLKQYKNGEHSGPFGANGDYNHHHSSSNEHSHGLVKSSVAHYDASHNNENFASMQQNSAFLNSATLPQPYRPNFSLAVAPLVMKHIYFHVPPPDVEVPVQTAAVEPPKKTYNIMFIKLPSQNSRAPVVSHTNQPASVEEKTLIYVLVRKPEPPVVVSPPAAAVSEHEVLYVKYRGEPGGHGASAAAGTHGLTPAQLSSPDPSLALQSTISNGY